MKHSAETRITGVVVFDPRCHNYSGGVVANVTVDVSIGCHTERYRCVAFKELGAEVQRNVNQGAIVSAIGYMKTSPYRDDPNKENQQLICSDFIVERSSVTAHRALNDRSPPPKQKHTTQQAIKPPPRQRRQYGRGVRKQRQDFTAVQDPEPFNDALGF